MACRKDQPVKWSALAWSGDADITTTQSEAYGLADFGHEYEELPTSEMTSQPPNPEYEIPTAQSTKSLLLCTHITAKGES